jgi:hypothetical protein
VEPGNTSALPFVFCSGGCQLSQGDQQRLTVNAGEPIRSRERSVGLRFGKNVEKGRSGVLAATDLICQRRR